LWEWYHARLELSGAEVSLLAGALEQLDGYRMFMDQVRAEGPVVTNPTTGATRQNPALSAAHACLRAARQTLKHLDLPDPEAEFQPRGSRSRGRR
jgi:phage terminase small subunit